MPPQADKNQLVNNGSLESSASRAEVEGGKSRRKSHAASVSSSAASQVSCRQLPALAKQYAEPLGAAKGANSASSAAPAPKVQSNQCRLSPASEAAANCKLQIQQPSADSLRYEYDDHYFLTEPSEFIYEFFPLLPDWQLLKSRPLTLAEFEELPFVRSLFFKYGLYFPQRNIRSTLFTDQSGAVSIKIGMPTHMIPSLIFHYNLKHFDSDVEHYDGVSLKRFVMQSVECGDACAESNIVSFRVHLPESGAYILDIFANSTTPSQYISGEPMKFKSVCKFKIVAANLKTVMVPLPNCASGEFGPLKATRLFGLIPISHEAGLICFNAAKAGGKLDIQFRMSRPLLDFMASLHKNNCDEKRLSNLISIVTDGTVVTISIKFADDGQYGLDLYTRDGFVPTLDSSQATCGAATAKHMHKKQLLTHCCKYLINVRGLK